MKWTRLYNSPIFYKIIPNIPNDYWSDVQDNTTQFDWIYGYKELKDAHIVLYGQDPNNGFLLLKIPKSHFNKEKAVKYIRNFSDSDMVFTKWKDVDWLHEFKFVLFDQYNSIYNMKGLNEKRIFLS